MDKDTIRGYKIIEELGIGSFGSSTLVEKSETHVQNYFYFVQDKLVMKQMEIRIGQSDLVLSDYRLIQAISNKPNICEIVDYFCIEQALYIISQYHEGGSMVNRMWKRKGTHFAESEIIKILQQLIIGLKLGHSLKLRHRNLKPQNILLSPDLHLLLTDFMPSSFVSPITEDTFEKLDKTYMSPESMHNKRFSKKSDIWSMGCIAYELATFQCLYSQPPHPKGGIELHKLKIQQILDGEGQIGNYSKEFRKLVVNMLKIDPKSRINLVDMQDDLNIVEFESQKQIRKKDERKEEKKINSLIREQTINQLIEKPKSKMMAFKRSGTLQITGELAEDDRIDLEEASKTMKKGIEYLSENSTGNALSCFEESYEIRSKVYGEKSQHTANCLHYISLCHARNQKYEEAIFLQTKVIETDSEIMGEEQEFVAKDMDCLADLYVTMEKYQEAALNYERSLNIRINLFGVDHLNTANSYTKLGRLFNNTADHKKAANYHLQALNIRLNKKIINTLGGAENYIGLSISSLKQVFLAKSKALIHLTKAQQIIQKLGETANEFVYDETVRYARLLRQSGTILIETGDKAEGIEDLQKAKETLMLIYPEDHKELVQIRELIDEFKEEKEEEEEDEDLIIND